MPKSVVIIGASGHGKVVADIILKSGDSIRGFLDDNSEINTIVGIPVLGKISEYKKYLDSEFIVAIGNPIIREKIVKQLKEVHWYTAIHPGAILSRLEVKIGEGTVIMANAVINSCANIGKHCIINTGAIIEHDNILEDYVHISPNVSLAGTVTVGRYTHIGVGACVKNNLNITKECVVGAGAVVIKPLVNKGTYVGVPARRIK